MSSDKHPQDPPPGGRLIPLIDFNLYHPDPTPAALRWLVFKNPHEFRRCVVRRGRRVLIDEVEYFRWLADQDTQKKH